MKISFGITVLAGFIVAAMNVSGDDADQKPVTYREHAELGQVHWQRDLDHAAVLAKQQQRPIAVLFQEVPG